ncbi:MAG: type I-E CRISPR-associated protein Cas5/CasD [Azoarcus sp.]|jgi:CRISPR system Cascade subunit CasD|nr:type I-E CRISPR-associated protein Cas5/CasD [Azoarcus sp.]
MDYLIFQLQGPLAAWGDPAVGEYRGSADVPGESALIGLLAAALGIERENEAACAALREGYRFAVGVQEAGQLLRDYHTAQVPGRVALKNRPHNSRRDELNMPREELNTILSTRDYRQNGAWMVAVQAQSNAPYTLEMLAAALHRPHFVLYLGRKSCPPAAPLHPRVMQSVSALQAFKDYLREIREKLCAVQAENKLKRLPLPEPGNIIRLSWGDGMTAGVEPTLTAPRKDRLIRRRGWHFGDRRENRAELPPEKEETCISA